MVFAVARDVWQLLGLRLLVARARWRRALGTGAGGATATLAGWFGQLFPLVMLAGAAIVMTAVMTALIRGLRGREELGLAAGTAGALTDVSIVLAAVAVLLGDIGRSGLDPRPLSLLPVRRTSWMLAELCALCAVHPAAVVVWSHAIALTVGASWGAPRAAPLVVMVTLGATAMIAAAAVLARALALELWLRGPATLLAPLVRVIALVVPVYWLFGRGANSGAILHYGDGFGPGSLVAQGMTDAWHGSLRALFWAGALGLMASGTMVAAWGVRLPRFNPARVNRWITQPSFRRVWGAPRALPPLLQSASIAAVVVMLAAFAHRRGVGAGVAAPLAAIVGAWLLASATAPLMANPLGLGGTAAASIGLLPNAWCRRLFETQLMLLIPPLLLVVALAIAIAALMNDRFAASLALGIGVAQLLVAVGSGCVCAVFWPWPMSLNDETDASWGPGAARLVVPAMQSVVLAPAGLAMVPGRNDLGLVLSCVGLAALIAVTGWSIAWWQLRRYPGRVSEALLS